MVDLKKLGENTITIDCDVIQADGGTRTAAITGAAVALVDAMNALLSNKKIKKRSTEKFGGCIPVGMYQDEVLLDLCHEEDSKLPNRFKRGDDARQVNLLKFKERQKIKPFTRQQSDAMLA